MEQLQKLIPENFRELFSFFAFFISLIFAFISLCKSQLEHGLRMAAILFIIALSLFAHNGYCYFGAIFIIATAVTQLDFLQNLAAIIRGSKEYFDFKKETISAKEVQRDIENESEIIEKLEVEEDISPLEKKSEKINLVLDKQALSPGQFGMVVEENVFKYLEQKFHLPIQRYVRIRSKRYVAAGFDGIMQSGDVDIIFEIKTTRRGVFPTSFLSEQIRREVDRVRDYRETTKRNASLRFILVGNFENDYKTNLLSRIPEIVYQTAEVEVTIDFLSFQDIGLDFDNV